MENIVIAVILALSLVLLFGCIGGSSQGSGYSSNIVKGGEAQSTPIIGGGSEAAQGAGGLGSVSGAGGSGSGAVGATATSGGSGASGKDPILLSPTEDSINIPLSQVSGTAKFFAVDFGLKKARFFAVKGADGKVHVALDACDVCGGKFGYRQEGDSMVCNKCGKSFRITDIGNKNSTGGGCWPSFLGFKAEGDNLVVSKAELGKNADRF
ncbi:MAG: DUF2318 domain-containing protein [Candidatus Micrarchaeota archaeon]